MELNTYQVEARKTQQTPETSGTDIIVPLLGLSGEVGELLSEYKKRLRDGDAHRHFPARVAEELGDILWYLADVASKFELTLDDIASQNLDKVAARWGNKQDGIAPLRMAPRRFDLDFPEHERLPRRFSVQFIEEVVENRKVVRAYVGGRQMGQPLTDNAHEDDGYRYHDVFHLACAAVLGWSPVTRRNLQLKRRSNPLCDEVEDGGRATVTEEGVSALVFSYAQAHDSLASIQSIDNDILKAIKIMTAKFEVAACTTGEWEQAILCGYQAWRQIEVQRGGEVALDLDARTLHVI